MLIEFHRTWLQGHNSHSQHDLELVVVSNLTFKHSWPWDVFYNSVIFLLEQEEWGGVEDDLKGRHCVPANVQGLGCFLKERRSKGDREGKHSFLLQSRSGTKHVPSACSLEVRFAVRKHLR